MNTLQNMRTFVAVVECGTFSGAARTLRVGVGTVSRNIAQLEARLNARLLHRTTRQLVVTETGKRYLQRCEHIIAQMSEAEREVKGANAPLAGSLRVHSMVGVGGHFLIPAIAHLRRQHPQVSFELTMGNRIPHFVEEGVDVAIVLADHLPDSGNVCQRLGETFNVLCASPGYIGTHGEPRAPTQVLEHQCLQLTGPTTALRQWRFECTDGVERITPNTGGFEVDASDTMISALEAGMGIGMLPIFAAQPAIDRGTLVRVLPSYRLQSLSVYAIYASRRYLDVRVKTLIDCLRSLVSAPMGDAAHDAPAAV